MRNLFSIFIACFSLSASAKFAPWVVEIPCSSIKIEVQKCDSIQINNYQMGAKKSHKKLVLTGSKVEAIVLEETPTKCIGQKIIDLKRFSKKFQKLNRPSNFILRDQFCPSLLKNRLLNVRTSKFLCDTPNAMMIEECFHAAIEHKQKSLIVDLIKK